LLKTAKAISKKTPIFDFKSAWIAVGSNGIAGKKRKKRIKNMSLKSLLLSALSFVLVAAVAVGGTLAYLTSTDSDVNVMTLGNVEIEQIEQERDENGNLIDFTQYQPALPAVYDTEAWATEGVEVNGVEYKVFSENMKNVVDKIVTVNNTGKNDAYVRTIIAIEAPNGDPNDLIHLNYNGTDVTPSTGFVTQIDGVDYYIVTYTYNEALGAGKKSAPSLVQLFLDKETTNEDCELFGDTWEVLAFSQAVQADGFNDPVTALNEAFGEISPTNQPWGDGPIHFPGYVYNQAELEAALEAGGTVKLGTSFVLNDTIEVSGNTKIEGNGFKLSRTAPFTGTMFKATDGATLELTNIVVDGGAIWTGEVNETLQRGTVNSGVTATGALVTTGTNSTIILGKDAVLQNNCGANAVNLPKSSKSKLIVNGGQIINNTSAAGAIWGGGAIEFNAGKISYNHATSIGGAIRVVSTMGSFTMNGGEMNHNYSNGTGGAIWGGNNSKYYLNGGEMAYNAAASAGGAIWTGTYESYYISGDFKLHDNSCGENIGGAIRFADHASLTMTGGSVYGNKANGQSNAFYLNNNSASITGGSIADNFTYSGGLGLTWGDADVDGVVAFSLGTNHNTAYLAESFGTLKFTVNEGAANFAKFNFKPAAGYTYTAGDEAKLVCMNSGYTTVWDAATSTFRLAAY